MRLRTACLPFAALALLPAPALAKCEIAKYIDIPVTMQGRRPIVTLQINGRDAQFILDSGAFYSTISRAAALEYGLSLRATGNGLRLKGIGGSSSLDVTTVKSLRLSGQEIPHVDFLVGGTDMGTVGLLGQNFLGFADVEYDLPHGTVRLMQAKDCRGGNLAYWAGPKPVTVISLDPSGAGRDHTVGTATLDGTKIRAGFDSGAQTSMITLAAAKRVGVTPDDATMLPSGFSYGVGQKRVRTWRNRFTKLDIGGEIIPHPWLAVADQEDAGFDMLVGIDFFLTHRMYVDNRNHRMFLTYEGGPLFGITPSGAVDTSGARLDLTDTAGEPKTALGFSQRGALRASTRQLEPAIADFGKAIAMEPTNAHYLTQRALAHLANRQPLLGAGDLDKALELTPRDAEARMARASLRLFGHDPAGALSDIEAADQALAPSSDMRLQLAGMYESVDKPAASLGNYDQWLNSHPEDAKRATAFNGRCWARALLNRDLDKALSDCDQALRLHPGEASYLDSRGLVRMRRGDFAKALVDYDAAIAKQPRNGWTLYCRSLVERRLGKTVQADADQTLALSIAPQVKARAVRLGIVS